MFTIAIKITASNDVERSIEVFLEDDQAELRTFLGEFTMKGNDTPDGWPWALISGLYETEAVDSVEVWMRYPIVAYRLGPPGPADNEA